MRMLFARMNEMCHNKNKNKVGAFSYQLLLILAMILLIFVMFRSKIIGTTTLFTAC